jgi:putative transposase
LLEPDHPRLSIVNQCKLLSVNRSSYYYQPNGEPDLNLKMMRLIDEQYLERPLYGPRQMTPHPRREGYGVSRTGL